MVEKINTEDKDKILNHIVDIDEGKEPEVINDPIEEV